MFRRKQDVDRHVTSILGKIKDERERSARGYQIARLYFEVREFKTAHRYLGTFLSVRSSVPQAYRLLGQIEESLGNKEGAVEAYKRCIEVGGTEKELTLKICELYAEIGVDPGIGKFWLEKAEQLYPSSDVIFKLKEKLLAVTKNDDELEKLICAELVKKPTDVHLRIRLLRLYMASGRIEDAYRNAVETDKTTAFTNVLPWYECVLDVFKLYQLDRNCNQDPVFMLHYLFVLCNLTYLRLIHKDVVESAEALHSFDQAVQSALIINSPSEEWDAFIIEMQGQLFFLAGTLLLKRAQKGSLSWNNIKPLAGVFYLLCQTIPTIDAQATWFVRPPPEREKLLGWLYKNSFFRLSQTGHTLYQLCNDDTATYAERLQQQCCSPVGQERAYEALFVIREMRTSHTGSYLMNTYKFCNTTLSMPSQSQMYDVDRVAHTFHPDNLSELVWICLQQYSFDDPFQPDYNFRLFETLQYSVNNMENGTPESLCQLDTEAFLYATVRCSALQVKEQQMFPERDIAQPALLPLCLCRKLCTPEQEQWWKTACSFYNNSIKDNFSQMRHILQQGLETVRLIGNHGMSVPMVIHLAKTFDSKVKSLTDGDHGLRGSSTQLAGLENRAAFYWSHALTMLNRRDLNQRSPAPKMRLFDDGNSADLLPHVVQTLQQEASFASSLIAMKEGRYEEAVRGFQNIATPWASFYRGQIYKALAQQELDGPGSHEEKKQKYAALIMQARDALYLTMDYLVGDSNHELNFLLTRELDDVESKLHCFDWQSEIVDQEETGISSRLATPRHSNHVGYSTPRHLQNNSQDDSVFVRQYSTPRDANTSKSVRQRLLMSLKTDSPIQHQQTATSHLRPSPERLEAQIKSINCSQSQLFRMVLDRNEELVVMYRTMVDKHQESEAQLKVTLQENGQLMEQLKTVLTKNMSIMTDIQKDLSEAKDVMKHLKDMMKHIREEQQTPNAAVPSPGLLSAPGLAPAPVAPGYFISSAYQPSQFPYVQPPSQCAPLSTSYRYPLLPGYPPPRPQAPSSAPQLSGLGGTAPSSFGKFRAEETTEDEEEDEENGLSMYGSEYTSEGLLQAPYYVQSDNHLVQDWMGQSGPAAMPYSPQSQSAVHQPGYFASALRGPSLQYTTTTTSTTTTTTQAGGTTQPLSIPGPGFFSTPITMATTTTSQSQLTTAPALLVKGSTSVSQQIPVLATGSAKHNSSVTTNVKTADMDGSVVVFCDTAKLTTMRGTSPVVEVVIKQNIAAKEGHIVIIKKETEEVISHNVASVRVLPSFNPLFFLWSLQSTSIEKKMDETFRLSFETAEQTKKMHATIDMVFKNIGLFQASPATAPAFVAKSATSTPLKPASKSSIMIVPTPSAKATNQETPSTPANTSAASKTMFGGFSFVSPPVVTTLEETKEKPIASPRFSLHKDNSTKVSSPTTTSTTTDVASASSVKPFAGFTLTPNKLQVFGSTVTSTTSSSSTVTCGQTFVFGQGTSASGLSFSTLAASPPASGFAKPQSDASGFKLGTQQLFQTGVSPVKSPGGEGVEEYEPNVDFKPVIELPELVEVRTGEEDEIKIFSNRVKAFRFDSEANQWKERGVGELKILQSKGKVRFRILMRREQVLKVCANHYISSEMKLTPLSSSDRAWCYMAQDFSEEEVKIEKIAIKFKDTDKAQEFRSVFEDCIRQLVAADAEKVAADSEKATELREPLPPAVKAQDKNATQTKSLSEIFKPSEGSWECPGCLIVNKSSTQRCPACETVQPGLKPEDVPAASKSSAFGTSVTSSGSFGSFGGFKLGPVSDGDKAAGGVGFKFGTQAQSSAGFKFGTSLALPTSQQKSGETPTSGGLSTVAAFRFTTGEGSGFKFSTPVTCASSTGFNFSTPTTSAPAGFNFSSLTSAPSVGFKFDNPTTTALSTNFGFESGSQSTAVLHTAASGKESANESTAKTGGSLLLEQLLTSDETPKIEQPAKGFLDTKQVPTALDQTKTTGFQFKLGSQTPSDVETTGPTGFQGKLGQVTSPKSSTGRETDGFQFTFSLTPQKSHQHTSGAPTTPKSPEADEQGFYLNKEGEDSHIFFEPVVPLPEKIEVKTGEEDEKVLLENRAKLYRFVDGEWKERGKGVCKILEHKESGRIRLLMRRDQVLKICCNHYITPELDLKPLPRAEGKAWVWYAMDFSESEGKMEQLAIRFRDADTAAKFKLVFEDSKLKMVSKKSLETDLATNLSSPGNLHTASKNFTDSEDDVVLLYEEKPTAEQVERARKLMLPDTFYLYENRPGCPGCIGCEDNLLTQSPLSKKDHQQTEKLKAVNEAALEKSTMDGVFGSRSAGTLTFSALATKADSTANFASQGSSQPFHWHGAGQRLFGASPGKDDGAAGEDTADGEVAPSDDVHFEPVIPLPDLVQVKTGEEDWLPLFCHRAKLYRFDAGQWKERGIGEMKVMQHKDKVLFRVLMRREQVLKVACNHLINTTMALKPLATSETSWCWVANDLTDSEPRTEQFAIKFKNADLAREFKAKFEECQEKLRQRTESDLEDQEVRVSSSQQASLECAPDATQPGSGDGGNQYCKHEVNIGAMDMFVAESQVTTGEHGNPYYSCELNVGAEDAVTSSTYRITGDRGNWHHTQELNLGAEDAVSSSSQSGAGDRGNGYHTQALDVSSLDSMVSTSHQVLGDGGNPYHSLALDVAAEDAIVAANFQGTGGSSGNPCFSQLLDAADVGGDTEEYHEDYEYEDDDDDEEDDDDDDNSDEEAEAIFEKRITLMNLPSGSETWKKLGMGVLRIIYDDDVNGYSLQVISDENKKLCTHMICQEHTITVNAKDRSCEWHSLDFSTDEPVKQHFRACFSSPQAAQEFAEKFTEGQKLAVESGFGELQQAADFFRS